MIPIVYEFIRVLKSKTVIILTVVIILFTLGIAFGVSTGVTTTTPQNQYISTAYGYGSNGSYNMTVELSNGYGTPVVGSTVNLTLYKGDVLKEKTNSHGIANFSVSNVNSTDFSPQPGTNYNFVNYNYTTVTGNVFNRDFLMYWNQTNPYFFTQISTYKLTNGTVKTSVYNNSRFILNNIQIQNQQNRNGLLIQYEGGYNGTIPKVDLYYVAFNTFGNGGESPPLSEKNMTLYGSYNVYSKSLSLQDLSGNSSTVYYFEPFTQSGQPIGFPTGVVVQNTATSDQVTTLFFAGEMALLGLFVPLMAAVSAYMTYGKDRTGSVLESVLVRPVSRRGLITSRYVANTLAVFIAALGSFLVTSFVFEYYLGRSLPTQTFEYGLWALFIGIAGFIGLVYLAATFLKSQGALLGFAISIFFVLDLFWTFLPLIPDLLVAYALRFTAGGLAYGKAIVALYYSTPVGFGNVARLILNGQASSIVYNVQGVTLAEIGITPAIMIGLGIVWIVAPIALATYAFAKRD